MKKMLKIVFITLAALVLLLMLVVLFWLGPAAKAIVEKIGPKALGTPVEIEYLSINPHKGTIDLRGFQIGLHEGFNRTNTWELADFRIAIDMSSLFSDTIVIHEIRIDSPHFIYEQSRTTDNISEFIRNIQAFAGIDPAAPKEKQTEEAEPTAEDGSGKKTKQVIIERLVITDVQMHLANTDDPQLDVQLGIEELSLSLTNGIVQLKHLVLSDPGLLSTPNVIEIEAIDIQIDPDSIYSDRIVIEDIQVIKPHAFLEQNADTDTVSEFMKLAQTFIDKLAQLSDPDPSLVPPVLSEAEGESKAETPDTPPEPPPFALHNLFVDDIQLKLLDTSRTNAAPEVRTMASIGSISVRLVEGRIQIREITIPNPDESFTTTNLFHLASIGITLDPESIFSDQVVIKEIFVDSPKINLEQTESSGNVAELQHIIKGFIPPAPEASTSEPPGVPKEERAEEPVPLAEQPVILEALIVTNFSVHMLTPAETNAPPTGLMGELSLKNLKPKEWFAGSESNAPITLVAFDRLSIEPLKGLVQIDNLQIGNPQGFAHDNLATIAQFRLDIDPDSIQTDTLLIEDILIDTPRIAYERQISTDNIKALQLSIEAALSKRGDIMDEAEPEAIPEPEPAATDEPAPAEQKVIIEHLLVQNGMVSAKLSALPSAPIPLPDIERSDMGKEEGGLGRTDALANLGTLFYDSIIGAVSSITGFAGDALKGIGTLTLGTLVPTTDDARDTDASTDGFNEEVVEEEPPPEEKKKKRRAFGGRRLPGRAF